MRYVVAVAETRNFTRAAKNCHVVQSALSHQVAALERELGVKLFARTSRRVELTAAGSAFLPSAQRALREVERAAESVAEISGDVGGQVTIGVIPTVAAVDLPRLLRTFHEAHPRVRISVRAGHSDELSTQVRDGDLDVALVGLRDGLLPNGVRHHELARDHLVAVLPSDHRLADRRRIRLRDLAGEIFVDFPTGSPGRAQSDHAFAAETLDRDVAFEAATTDLMIGLVDEGLAIAMLPGAYVRRHLYGRTDLRCVDVVGGATRVEHLIWSDFNLGTAAARLVVELGGRPA